MLPIPLFTLRARRTKAIVVKYDRPLNNLLTSDTRIHATLNIATGLP